MKSKPFVPTKEELKEQEEFASKSSHDVEFLPDWTKIWTAKQAETELLGFQFRGPGWYIEKQQTILVVPASFQAAPTDVWKHSWPEETRFVFHVYDGRNPLGAFSRIASAPTRLAPLKIEGNRETWHIRLVRKTGDGTEVWALYNGETPESSPSPKSFVEKWMAQELAK